MKKEKERDLLDEYNSIVENEYDYVKLRDKKIKINWLRPGTQRKLGSIMSRYSEDDTLQYRCAAVCVLNDFFKIKLFYWFLWRWYFYVKQYLPSEVSEIFEVSKKKIQVADSLKNMVSLVEVRGMLKSQTMSLVESLVQKQTTEQHTPLKED